MKIRDMIDQLRKYGDNNLNVFVVAADNQWYEIELDIADGPPFGGALIYLRECVLPNEVELTDAGHIEALTNEILLGD